MDVRSLEFTPMKQLIAAPEALEAKLRVTAATTIATKNKGETLAMANQGHLNHWGSMSEEKTT